jgi:hypothetical protein
MPQVLGMTTFELGHPVLLLILMITKDAPL